MSERKNQETIVWNFYEISRLISARQLYVKHICDVETPTIHAKDAWCDEVKSELGESPVRQNLLHLSLRFSYWYC